MIKRIIDRRKNIIALALIVAVALAMFAENVKHKHEPNFVERGVLSFFAFLQNPLVSVHRGVLAVWYGYVNLVGVKQRNDELERRVREQEFEMNVLREKIMQYDRLSKYFEFPDPGGVPRVFAKVIGRDTSLWTQMITLDAGKASGLRQDMPVVTPAGLAGRIVSVSGGIAKVLLITDVQSAVDAIAQRTRDSCVVEGTNKSGKLRVKFVPMDSTMEPGDTLISSGLGGIFPKGLVIGKVTRVIRPQSGLFLTVELAPSADIGRLEEAEILVTQPGDATGFTGGAHEAVDDSGDIIEVME